MKTFSMEQNEEAVISSDSVMDLVDNFEEISPFVPASRPMNTAALINCIDGRAAYMEQVAVLSGRIQCHRHGRDAS